MKKVYALLFLVIICLSGVIIYLLNKNLNSTVVEDNTLLNFEQTLHYTETKLSKSDFDNEITVDGIVSGDNYIETWEKEFIYSEELYVDKDVIIPAETPVLRVDYPEYTFPSPIRVIDYSVTNSEDNKRCKLTYLNYDRLYINASYDEKYADKVSHNTKINVFKDNAPLTNVVIDSLGYEIKDGKASVRLKSSELLLPGTSVKVQIIFETLKDQWIIKNDFIKSNKKGDKYLTYLDESGLEEDINISVICEGEEYSAIDIDPNYADRRFVYGNS